MPNGHGIGREVVSRGLGIVIDETELSFNSIKEKDYMKTLNVINIGFYAFECAMMVAFCDGYGDNHKAQEMVCDGYKINEKNQLILSLKSSKSTKLPFSMDKKQTIDFAWGFIKANKPFNEQGNGDGSYEKGFTVSDDLGYDDHCDFIKCYPCWIYYGK